MSDTYRIYQEARNAAWRALLRLEKKTLPVDAEALARSVGVEIHPFPDPQENRRLWNLARQKGGVCTSLRIRGEWHIFVREGGLDDSRRRFAVAHELGHLLLGHETRTLAPGVKCFRCEGCGGDAVEEPQDQELMAADVFALRLLSPACLMHELRADTPAAIAALCALPPQAAVMRAERMLLLNQRNAFYKDPLERRVRDAFLPFLRSRTNTAPPVRRAVPLVIPPLDTRKNQADTPSARQARRKRPPFRPPRSRWWAVGAAVAALIVFFLLGRKG